MSMPALLSLKQIEGLHALLTSLGDVRQAKLAYTIAKNKSHLKKCLDIFQEAVKPTPEMMSFEKARQQLLEEHAEKDPKTKRAMRTPVPGGPGLWQYTLKDEGAYQEAFDALKLEHEHGVRDIVDLEERRQQLLEEKEAVQLHTVKYAELKEDDKGNLPVNSSQLGALLEAGIIIEE